MTEAFVKRHTYVTFHLIPGVKGVKTIVSTLFVTRINAKQTTEQIYMKILAVKM